MSSSGFRDGLGERVLVFDRPVGEVRERLRVRPEIAAFEAALGAQIDRVSKLTDPRFPRARDVDRDRITGQVVVISDYMPGERLSDLLEIAREKSVFPDLAAALQTAGELLLAMASFSGALKTVHGAIAPSRVVISETGEVGLTDYIFAPILPRLRFSASRLWSDLGVAGGADGATFDEASDARQIALVLVAMALGRPIEASEYPHKIQSLVAEVSDVALISGGDGLATGLRAWLERALNLEGRQGFGNMAHACASFGQLTFDGGGLAGSRSALVTFLQDVVRPPQIVEAPPPPPPVLRVVPPPAPAPLKKLPKIEPIVFATPDPEPILIPESESIEFTLIDPEPEPAAAVTPEPYVIPTRAPEPVLERSEWTPEPEPVVLAKSTPPPIEHFTPGPEFAPISDPEPIVAQETPTFEPVRRRESWLEPGSGAAEPPFEFSFNVPAEVAPKPVLEPIEPVPASASGFGEAGSASGFDEAGSASASGFEGTSPASVDFGAARSASAFSVGETGSASSFEPAGPTPVDFGPARSASASGFGETRSPAPLEKAFEEPAVAVPETAHMTVLERLERLVHKLASPFPMPHPAPPPVPPPVEPPASAVGFGAAGAVSEAGTAEPEPPPRLIAPLPVAAPEPEPVAAVAPEPPPAAEPAPEPAPVAPPPLAPAMVPEPAPAAELRDKDKKKKKPKKLKVRKREPDPQAPPPVHVTPPPPPPAPPALAYVLPDIPPPGVVPLPRPAAPFPTATLPDIPPPGVVPLPPPAPIFPAMPPRTVAPPVLATPPAPPAPIRLKDPAPEVIAHARKVDRHVGFTARPESQYRAPSMIDMPDRPRLDLWKFAAILVVLAVVGFAAFKFGFSSEVTVEPGMLTVESTPAGSQVFVDEELKGKTPLTIPVAAGKHELKLTRRGLTYEKSIVIEEGKTRVERYAWSRARQPGRGGLRVSSEPPGAKVYVDGKLQGETPLDLPNTPVGSHTVTIESGIGTVRRTVNVVRGEEALVDVELYSGFVKVFAPIELELSVNGRPVGNGSEPIMLPPGQQQILAVNRDMGYREVHTIEVEPGETRTLTITPIGRLTVTAVPFAEVWIDETRMGRTPITNRRVPIGTHTLVLRHPEHGERKVVATIKHNELTSVPVDMTKP